MPYEDNAAAQKAKGTLEHYLILNNPKIMHGDRANESDCRSEARSIIDNILDAVLYEAKKTFLDIL